MLYSFTDMAATVGVKGLTCRWRRCCVLLSFGPLGSMRLFAVNPTRRILPWNVSWVGGSRTSTCPADDDVTDRPISQPITCRVDCHSVATGVYRSLQGDKRRTRGRAISVSSHRQRAQNTSRHRAVEKTPENARTGL